MPNNNVETPSVAWRVFDPDGNVVQFGYGPIELEMTTNMGDQEEEETDGGN